MITRILEWLCFKLINRYIGDYVDNLKRSQLKLENVGGNVELQNVDVKESVLNGLDLPITIRTVKIGKLTIKTPLLDLLRKKPVVVSVEGLYALAVPNTETPEKKSFAEKMNSKNMKNLQVHLNDIHLLYEDRYTNINSPLHIDITLEDFLFQSTDRKNYVHIGDKKGTSMKTLGAAKDKGHSSGFIKQLPRTIITIALAFWLFNYMDTQIPEGATEVWSARILNTALKTHWKIIHSLHYFGFDGGVTWWTRKLVDVVSTTMITGSPFGLGNDPELEVNSTTYGGVDVLVYEPVGVPKEKRPVIVYYHGGGWSWLSVDVYDQVTRELAKRVKVVVVSVAYRQPPEYPHPIPFEDCLKATEYVIENAERLGIDATRVAISGDGAGGQLSAAVSLRLKKKIKIQIPIYPCLQMLDLQTPSYIENKQYVPGMLNKASVLVYWLNYANISYNYIDKILANEHTSRSLKNSRYARYIAPKWYMKEHIRSEKLRNMKKPADFGDQTLSRNIEKTLLDPYFAPLMANKSSLEDLPFTYVFTAGYDILRDDGLIYYKRLVKAGVPVKLAHYKDGFHGMIFFFKGPLSFQVGVRAMKDLCSFLKTAL